MIQQATDLNEALNSSFYRYFSNMGHTCLPMYLLLAAADALSLPSLACRSTAPALSSAYSCAIPRTHDLVTGVFLYRNSLT